jgi:DNA-directed RNA polymerase specialized sigma24 family protein
MSPTKPVLSTAARTAVLRYLARRQRQNHMTRGRRSEIVAYYVAGHSLRACAKRFGVSFQRVHQIIQTESPEVMRIAHVTFVRAQNRT